MNIFQRRCGPWLAVVAATAAFAFPVSAGEFKVRAQLAWGTDDMKPNDPALRFLLGYHYGFLGYPKDGLKQLDKCLELAPKDELAQKLQERMKDILNPKAPTPKPAASTPAVKSEEKPSTTDDKTP